MMIAKEAVDRVIETSRRFIGEAQDQAPGSPDTRGRKRPPQTVQLENQELIGPLNQKACELTHKPATGGDKLLFEIILAELGLATYREPAPMGAVEDAARKIHESGPEDMASVSMVKVWPTPTLGDRRIPEPGENVKIPRHQFPKFEGVGNPEHYAVFDRASGHRQIPFREFEHAKGWAIQNLPPKQWYRSTATLRGFLATLD